MSTSPNELGWNHAVELEDYDSASEYAEQTREIADQTLRELAFRTVYLDPESPLYFAPASPRD